MDRGCLDLGQTGSPQDHVVGGWGTQDIELARVGDMPRSCSKGNREVYDACYRHHVMAQAIQRILVANIHPKTPHIHSVDCVLEHNVHSGSGVYQHLFDEIV